MRFNNPSIIVTHYTNLITNYWWSGNVGSQGRKILSRGKTEKTEARMRGRVPYWYKILWVSDWSKAVPMVFRVVILLIATSASFLTREHTILKGRLWRADKEQRSSGNRFHIPCHLVRITDRRERLKIFLFVDILTQLCTNRLDILMWILKVVVLISTTSKKNLDTMFTRTTATQIFWIELCQQAVWLLPKNSMMGQRS